MTMLYRRDLLRGVGLGVGATLLPSLAPAWARSGTAGLGAAETLSGEDIALSIGHSAVRVAGRTGHAVTVNGRMPAPLLRLREGQKLRIAVTNTLNEDSSIHWHGLLLPFQYDGVPGISFPGIRPGETFTYDFPVRQSGTYWYHSHSNMQEAMGLFGAIVIDPAGGEAEPAEREHVLVLSDWSFLHPHEQLKRLKQSPGHFNRQRQTVAGLLAGRDQPLAERLRWAAMRMDPTDISDVTASAYTYLVNGHETAGNWTGLFTPGERVRLRIVNASAMTNFNVRLPELEMIVVAADGLPVSPVPIDEFQIAVAETYDVIVRPPEDRAYAVVAEALDRSGLCRATLAPRMGMVAQVPPLRERPLLTMKDMGMCGTDGGAMDHAAMGHGSAHNGAARAMSHAMRDPASAPDVKLGPGVASLAPMPADRISDRPTGLETVPHRVLTYADLKTREPHRDQRPPVREIEVNLTANMERYMWSFDGVKFSEGAEPIAFRHNERVRVTLINHTMMPHPIHLHGHFFEVVNGAGGHQPLKHTVNVLPGAKLSFDLTADALGDWAFHCHMLMHMHSGMFRVVTVRHEHQGH